MSDARDYAEQYTAAAQTFSPSAAAVDCPATETGLPCDERDWSWWLKIVFALTAGPIGAVSCVIALLVFSRRRSLCRTSFSVYLRAQCVVDATMLLAHAFYKLADLMWFLSDRSVSLLSWQNELACQLMEMLKKSLYMITVWMTVCYCLDRYAAIRFPLSLKTRALRRPKTARYIASAVCLVTVLIESYYLFTYTRADYFTSEGRVCQPRRDDALKEIFSVMDKLVHVLVFSTGLPLMAVVALNLLTVLAMRRHATRVPTESDTSEAASRVSRKLTKVTVSVSIFYVICSLPHMSIAIVDASYKFAMPGDSWKLRYVADGLSKLFFVSNFVVYSVMRRQFLDELKKTCKCDPRYRRDVPERQEHGLLVVSMSSNQEPDRTAAIPSRKPEREAHNQVRTPRELA